MRIGTVSSTGTVYFFMHNNQKPPFYPILEPLSIVTISSDMFGNNCSVAVPFCLNELSKIEQYLSRHGGFVRIEGLSQVEELRERIPDCIAESYKRLIDWSAKSLVHKCPEQIEPKYKCSTAWLENGYTVHDSMYSTPANRILQETQFEENAIKNEIDAKWGNIVSIELSFLPLLSKYLVIVSGIPAEKKNV